MKRDEYIYDEIEKEKNLLRYSGEDEVVLSQDLLASLEIQLSEKNEVEMKSGFPGLDEQIHHFLGGELIILSGPTKHGKTLMAQTLTKNFYSQGIPALWFSYEVPAYQFLKQFGDQLPIFSIPKELKDNSPSWIIERVHEAKLKYNISAVFIDNTHNVLNLTTNNLSQVMGEFVKVMKKMAMKFNIAVFLLHHMSKTRLDEGESISSASLRDSSMIAQTADTVMFVWRDKDTIICPRKSYLKVTENRRYGVFNYIMPMQKVGNFLYQEEN
jgi:replicative DNA helicase